jgi:hypothetical protein
MMIWMIISPWFKRPCLKLQNLIGGVPDEGCRAEIEGLRMLGVVKRSRSRG